MHLQYAHLMRFLNLQLNETNLNVHPPTVTKVLKTVATLLNFHRVCQKFQ